VRLRRYTHVHGSVASNREALRTLVVQHTDTGSESQKVNGGHTGAASILFASIASAVSTRQVLVILLLVETL
jgi:hypothetical protein